MKKLLFLVSGVIFIPVNCFAVQFITSSTFDGVEADVTLVAVSIIGLFVTIAAVGIIIRGMFGGR